MSSLNLHGTVNNPVWSQRLQTLDLHDHYLQHTHTHTHLQKERGDKGKPQIAQQLRKNKANIVSSILYTNISEQTDAVVVNNNFVHWDDKGARV